MLRPDAALEEFSDEVLSIALPAYHTLQQGSIGQGEALEIGYFSTLNLNKRGGRSESVLIHVRAPGSPRAAQLKELLLIPLSAPIETVLRGPSDLVPGGTQRITIVPTRGYFAINLAISDPRGELMLQIQSHGEFAACQPRWNEVQRSLHLNESFRFDHWQPSTDTAPPPRSPKQSKISARLRAVLGTLPESLAFLRPALINIGEQAIADAEDADLSLLLTVVKQKLKQERLASEQSLVRWFEAYDHWWRKQREITAPELAPLGIVHGALLGFSQFGLDG